MFNYFTAFIFHFKPPFLVLKGIMYHVTTEFGSMVSTPAFLILLIYLCFIWYTFYIVLIYSSCEISSFTTTSKATTPDDLNIPNLFPVLTIYRSTCSSPCVRLTILVFDQCPDLPVVIFFLPNPNRSAHKQKAGECTNSFTKIFYFRVEILSKQLMNMKNSYRNEI